MPSTTVKSDVSLYLAGLCDGFTYKTKKRRDPYAGFRLFIILSREMPRKGVTARQVPGCPGRCCRPEDRPGKGSEDRPAVRLLPWPYPRKRHAMHC